MPLTNGVSINSSQSVTVSNGATVISKHLDESDAHTREVTASRSKVEDLVRLRQLGFPHLQPGMTFFFPVLVMLVYWRRLEAPRCARHQQPTVLAMLHSGL